MPIAVTDTFHCVCHCFHPASCQSLSLIYSTARVTPFTLHHFQCVCHCYQPASCQPLSLIYFTACHFYQTASCQPLALIYFTACVTAIRLHYAIFCHRSISLPVSLLSACIMPTAVTDLFHHFHCVCHCFQPTTCQPLSLSYFTVSLLSANDMPAAVTELFHCVTAFSQRHASRCH